MANNKTISAGNQYLPDFGEKVYEQESRNGNLQHEMALRLRQQMSDIEADRQNMFMKAELEKQAMEAEYALKAQLAKARGAGGAGGGGAGVGADGTLAVSNSDIKFLVEAAKDLGYGPEFFAGSTLDKSGRMRLPANNDTMAVMAEAGKRRGKAQNAWADMYQPNAGIADEDLGIQPLPQY